MANGTPKPSGSVKNGRNALLVALVSAILGGAGGPLLLVKLNPTALRPDPFTGSEARVLSSRVAQLEYHVRNHPDATGRFENRIATLEAQNQIIIQNQQRIMNRIDDIGK